MLGDSDSSTSLRMPMLTQNKMGAGMGSQLNKCILCFFFLIRNEENYIKRRKDTRERRDTREREENKRRMRGPSFPQNKTEQKRKHPTLEN